MKKLIVFDLDGTLAESKSSLDGEMSALLGSLLAIVKVAIISGGGWAQFQKQVLANLSPGDHLANLSLLPTCGTQFYRFDGEWKKIYSEDFTATEKEKIIGDALFPGGNDYPAEEAGAYSIRVRDPEESKHVIEAIIACL